MKNQQAVVFLKEDALLDPAAVREAVKKADFSPGDIHLSAAGEVVSRNDSLLLTIPGTGQQFPLIAAATAPDALAELAKTSTAAGRRVTIRGRLHESGKTLQLVVQSADSSGEKP